MRIDTVAKPRIVEGKKQTGLDSIILYDKKFYYPKTPHIQYLDSYMTDFVFVNDFPKVLESMAKKLDQQRFRDMLKSAVRTNLKLYNDGELLNPEAERLIKAQWHGYLFHDFLGEESDNYIIRGDYFKGNSVPQIKDFLNNNIRFSLNQVLPKIRSDVDYRNARDKTLMRWLIDYSRSEAMSKKYN